MDSCDGFTQLRCDICGRFADEKGTRRLVTPDSDYSAEEYETLCNDCSLQEGTLE